MSIIRTNEARLDLVDLACYISLDNLEAAYRFLDAAEETFADLERMPLMGSASTVTRSTLGFECGG